MDKRRLQTIEDIFDAIDAFLNLDGCTMDTKVLIMTTDGRAVPLREISGFSVNLPSGTEDCVMLVPDGSPGAMDFLPKPDSTLN